MILLRVGIIIFALIVFATSAIIILSGSGPLATVNGQQVDKLPPPSDLDALLCINDQCANKQIGRLRSEIYHKWLQQEASRLGLTISSQQISQRLEVDYQTSRRDHRPLPTAFQIQNILLAEAISQKIPQVIANNYRQTPSTELKDNPQTIRRNLNVVRVSSQADAILARRAIANGKSFSDVNGLYQSNRSANKRAYYPAVAAGAFSAQIERVLQASPPGTLLPVMSAQGSFFIIKFISVASEQVSNKKSDTVVTDARRALLPWLRKSFQKTTFCKQKWFNNFCGGKL